MCSDVHRQDVTGISARLCCGVGEAIVYGLEFRKPAVQW